MIQDVDSRIVIPADSRMVPLGRAGGRVTRDLLQRCPAGAVVVALVMDDDELLPLLTLSEAQGVVGVLAAVVAGQRVDGEVAGRLLSELAARVPSRD
ncbi:hypothetical protein [Streptomyces venezuelae]|uniref:hypothetical protein n=1 Tax=Streptomyces venezuelae TaxID=54571 RepID=UPI00343C0F46